MTGHEDEGGYFTSTDFLRVTGKGPEVEYIRHYLRHHPKVTEQGPEVEYQRSNLAGVEGIWLKQGRKLVGLVPKWRCH